MTTSLLEPEPSPPVGDGRPPKVRTKPSATPSIFDPPIVRSATLDALRKLDPRNLVRNPVMLIVEVGAVLTTVLFFRDLGDSTGQQNMFAGLVAAFLWFTVLFANFAEAMAEGRGKAQAATLRATRADTIGQRAARRRHGRAATVGRAARSATVAWWSPAR